MWRHSICGIFLDVKKFDMYREKDNKIYIVLPWHSWYLCCFVAKFSSVAIHAVLSRHLFCHDTYFVAIYALSMWRKIKPKVLSVEKK